jgi:hypothetical protein
MWTATYEETTELTPPQIWPIIADIARWPEVDTNIERLEIAVPPAPGAQFRLKPRGGPTLGFRVGHFDAPTRYSDVCKMLLATMETFHELESSPNDDGKTRVRVRVEIRGLLAPLWALLVGRKHVAGIPAQTARILARARTLEARSAAAPPE